MPRKTKKIKTRTKGVSVDISVIDMLVNTQVNFFSLTIRVLLCKSCAVNRHCNDRCCC